MKCEVSCINEAKKIFIDIKEISVRAALTISIISQITKTIKEDQ
jgi:hypothetical protein